MSNAASRGARTQMVLEAKRARHSMHVVVSVSVAESTANERTIYETTELIDMHVHIQHNCTQHAASTRLGIDATCTPDIDLDGHTYHVTTPSAQHHQIRRPSTGCCMGPNRASIALHDAYALGRRCRWPLAALPGKPTFCTSRKCSAHMDTRGTCEIDHGYT